MLESILPLLRWAMRSPMMGLLFYMLVLRDYSRRRTAFTLVVCVQLYVILGGILLRNLPQELFYQIILVIDIAWSLLTARLISPRKGFYTVFLAFTVISVVDAADTLCSHVSGLPHYQVINLLLKLVVYPIIFMLLKRFFRGPYLDFTAQQNQGWLLYAAFPMAFELYMGTLVYSRMHSGLAAIDHYGLGTLAGTLTLTAMLALYYVSLYSFFQLNRRQRAVSEQNQALRLNLEAVTRYEQAINSIYDSIRTYRHDLRHYISLMQQAADVQEASPQVGEMLAHLDEMVESHQIVHAGKSLSVNSLLQHYAEICQRENITFQHALLLPEPFPVNYYDFLVAFCNAMENAINACCKIPPGQPRSIRIESSTLQSQFVLSLSNTFTGELVFDPVLQTPTTREPGHGYGTLSILGFAQKYGIQLLYVPSGNILTLTLTMNLPSN